jgi:hypothetical protein
MSIGGFFLLLVLAIVVIALVLWFTGVAGGITLQRDRRGSDKEVGAGARDDGARPLHKGGVPEQEETEKTEFVPRSGVPSGRD